MFDAPTWFKKRKFSRFAILIFVISITLAAFFAGMYIQESKRFPYSIVNSAYKSLSLSLEQYGIIRSSNNTSVFDASNDSSTSDIELKCGSIEETLNNHILNQFPRIVCPDSIMFNYVVANRFEFIASNQLADPIMMSGGVGTFIEHCPGTQGCIAVAYSKYGDVVHSYPYRPEELEPANIVPRSDYPHEVPVGWQFIDNIKLRGLASYPDGDILVVFRLENAYPYGDGIARVAPGGQIRWYRKDFSHHWPHITDNDVALVPSAKTGRGEWLDFRVGNTTSQEIRHLHCTEGFFDDYINVIDGDGILLEEVSILDAIVESPYATILTKAWDNDCDPTHLNFVHMIDQNAAGIEGIQPGDLVVSLRNLDAFGIIDRDTRELKRLVRGSFVMQHAVHHLEKTKFLMFDNRGTDGVYGPSRLLMIDIANGQETTVFPNSVHLQNIYTDYSGQIDISPDRQRALISDNQSGRGFEIRISDGAILNIFHSIHDVSHLEQMPKDAREKAWRFRLHGIHYTSYADKNRTNEIQP